MEVVEKGMVVTKKPTMKVESLFYRFPLLSCFDNFEAKKIASYTEKKVFRKNEVIPKDSSRTYFVLRGSFGSFYSHPESRKDFLIRKYDVGDCVDLQSLLDLQPGGSIIRASEKSEALSISKFILQRELFQCRKALHTAIILQSKMVRDSDYLAATIALLDVRDRLKIYIAENSIKQDDRHIYPNSVSNVMISFRLGASREMVSRCFNGLIEDGELVPLDNGTLLLTDLFSPLRVS